MAMQQEALEAPLTGESVAEEPGLARKPLSRPALVWQRLRRMPRFWVGFGIFVALVLMAFVAPLVYPFGPTDRDPYNMNMGPTTLHWFGTNAIGQDIYAQTLSGLQKSLIIGMIAGPAATLIAAFIGAAAGYIGGWTDRTLSWMIHLLLVIPSFYIFVLLSPLVKGLSWLALTIFLAAFSWMIMAQVVRNQTRSLRNRDFVRAARYMGMSSGGILRRHIIPNIASLLIIDATLGVVAAIMAETSLSYFGFGVQKPEISLGNLLADGASAAVTRPWLFVFPAGVLIILLFAISLVGDALRDAIDPTSGNNRD
ncbi:ABC transporter permease [Microbacterium pullorum]|nr:ABC transporter permease [Microbacterium pullorum]